MKLGWTTLMLLLLALGAPAAAPDESAQLQFADGLFRRGIYDMALKEYMLFLETYPSNAAADAVWFRSGECYREMGNRVAADKTYARVQAMPASPQRFRAALRRAELLLDSGQTDAAAALLQALLGDKPPPEIASDACFRLAGALEKLNRPAEAVPLYERLARDYPESPFIPYTFLALGGLSSGSPGGEPRAEGFFTKAAEKSTDPRVGAEAWYQLGNLYYRGSNYVKSAFAFDQLFTRFGTDTRVAQARFQAAWAYQRAARYADAVALADRALAAGEAPRDGWLYLAANGDRQLQRHAAAAARYETLMKEFPGSVYAGRAGYERALALFAAGQYAEATAQARVIPPDSAMADQVCWLLAESAIALKDENQALQYYRLIAEQHPKSALAPEALYRIGDVLKKRGEDWNAAEAYRAVFARYPDSTLAAKGLFAAAYGAAKANRREDAARDWGQFLTSFPDHELAPDALFQKAVAEAQLGRNDQALDTYSLLLKRFPRTAYAADARFWSGVLLETSGKYEDAARELRASLASEPSENTARLARMRLGIVLFRLEQYPEAAELAQGVIATPLRADLPPGLLEWLAEYRIKAKEYPKALEAARLLASGKREPSWVQIGRTLAGEALNGLGQAADSKVEYEAAVAVEADTPAKARAWLKLGDMALAASDFAGAEKAYGEAAQRAGNNEAVRAYATAGTARALEGKGDADGAVRFYMNVALLYHDPDLTPECLYKAAAGFKRQGRAKEAADLVAELKKLYPQSPWAAKE
jgi:cellulose synthase operon protein C